MKLVEGAPIMQARIAKNNKRDAEKRFILQLTNNSLNVASIDAPQIV
jgi:hypothetical protein